MSNAGSEVTAPFDLDTFVGMSHELLSRVMSMFLKNSKEELKELKTK